MGKTFTLSKYSLGAFRVLLGIYIILKFCLSVLPNFEEIFSPEIGILGNCYAQNYKLAYKSFGPFFVIETDFGLYLVIAIIILLGIFFIVGFYPKLSGWILFFFLAWFHDRYSTLYFGWESYFSSLFFLALFLPINCRFSLFPSKEPTDGIILRFFGFLLLFQIGFIYFYNGISKNGDYWLQGEAVLLAVAQIDKTTPFTAFLINNPAWAHMFSWGALAIEVGIMFLLFIPFKNDYFRYLSAILILVFHWAISIYTNVGYFKYVAIIASVVILPEHFWQTSLIKKLCSFNIKKRTLPALQLKLPTVISVLFGLFLLSQMIFSNLAQTSQSKSNDRFASIIKNVGLKTVVNKFWIVRKPYYSYFGQYWHLYSPNPPGELGYTLVEGIDLNGNTVVINDGKKVNSVSDASYLKQLMYAYITLRGGNNKDIIMSQCLLSREMNLFLSDPKNPRLKTVDLVTYSYRPQNASDIKIKDINYSRVIRQQITLTY